MFKRFALLSFVLSVVVNPVFANGVGETESDCDQIVQSTGNTSDSTGSTSTTTSGSTGGSY